MGILPVAVCGRSEVKHFIRVFDATHVFSLIDRDKKAPPQVNKLHHRLWLMEDSDCLHEDGAPTLLQIKYLLACGKELPDDARLLVHCEAGACRSTAAALAIMVQNTGDLIGSGERLVNMRPQSCPNILISWHADNILGLNGELLNLAEEISAKYFDRTWGINYPALKDRVGNC